MSAGGGAVAGLAVDEDIQVVCIVAGLLALAYIAHEISDTSTGLGNVANQLGNMLGAAAPGVQGASNALGAVGNAVADVINEVDHDVSTAWNGLFGLFNGTVPNPNGAGDGPVPENDASGGS